MLINLNQLDEYLQTYMHSYAIIGDESLLIEQTKQKIISIAKPFCGCTKTAILDGINSNAWQEVLNMAASYDLIDGKTFICAYITNGKIGKFANIIENLIQQKADIVFILPKLDKLSKQSSWFINLQQKIICIDIPTIDKVKMPSWVEKTAKDMQLNLDKQSINWLSTQFEGNLISAYNELQKLSLAYSSQPINLEMLYTAILDISQYKVYDLLYACLAGNTEQVIKITNFLKNDSPILFIWLLIEELTLIIDIKYKAQSNNLYNILKNLRIWGEREKYLTQFINKFSLKQLYKYLEKIYIIELQIKGASPHSDNLWQSIELLCLHMCR